MAARPRGQLRTPRLMGEVYSAILDAMEKQGWAPPRDARRSARSKLLMIVLRYGLAR